MIWRQSPKVDGGGHYGHRIAFGDGYLWISSGERQKFDPAQDMNANLGKVVRLNEDGSVPRDNPFADRGGVTAQIWSLGHRNLLGLAFDAAGPALGRRDGADGRRRAEPRRARRQLRLSDRLQRRSLRRQGHSRPRHAAGVRGAGRVLESGDLAVEPDVLRRHEFPQWQGDAFIGGLSSQAIVRIEFDGDNAREAERYDMGMRMRAIEQGPDGAIWMLEDEREGRGGEGRMFKLTARGASGQ